MIIPGIREKMGFYLKDVFNLITLNIQTLESVEKRV